MLNLSKKLILALDVNTPKEARHFVNLLYPKVKMFKVGSQLFTACGPKIIKMVNQKGGRVFLDLKFHDIPNTVANAVRQAVGFRVQMLTLHISGGREMLKQAIKAAKEESRRIGVKRPLLVGVTVLTSQKVNPSRVLRLARLGIDCGLDGVVCSTQEAMLLRKTIKKRFIIVTPGIRPKSALVDDQKRTATAEEAIKSGSDFLVVGRPILKAVNPLESLNDLI